MSVTFLAATPRSWLTDHPKMFLGEVYFIWSSFDKQNVVLKATGQGLDEAIADEMDSGKILPCKAKLRDEVSRNGTPQQLVMLEYREYNNCQVHIHIAEGTRFGHIKVGEQRHQLTPEQSDMILTYAQHILPVIDYDKRSKHSEGKGFNPGYQPPNK